MCRLFGLRAARDVTATFWLLDAPDNLARQSRQEPDGAGIGIFDANGTPVVDKQPVAAYSDAEFTRAARELRSDAFIAHVRYASTGALTVENTHPFTQDGRIFAHNGAMTELDPLDRRLSELGVTDLVHGQTDSERMFALITAEIRRADGDVDAGIDAAVSWLAANVSVLSLNFILAEPGRMWAVRYPATHELYVLEREENRDSLDANSDRIHARSDDLADSRCVVIATERMDDDPGWRLLDDGEVLRIDADLTCASRQPFAPPAHPLTIADLGSRAAASQTA